MIHPVRLRHIGIALAAPLALTACATTAPPSPVEVTRFVAPGATLGATSLFVESAPGTSGLQGDSLALAPFKAAVAAQLERLGYSEQARSAARHVAQVRVERFVREEGGRRSPVSVGVGGGTGTYGSGVGVGLGINLGGSGGGERVTTQLGVMLREAEGNAVVWEGRAEFDAGAGSTAAQPDAAAAILAQALFEGFPGANGETILVEVD